MDNEQIEFFRDAARAIHAVAFMAARMDIPPDDITPARVQTEFLKLLPLAAEAKRLRDENARLKHDLDSVKATNETLADRITQVEDHADTQRIQAFSNERRIRDLEAELAALRGAERVGPMPV